MDLNTIDWGTQVTQVEVKPGNDVVGSGLDLTIEYLKSLAKKSERKN